MDLKADSEDESVKKKTEETTDSAKKEEKEETTDSVKKEEKEETAAISHFSENRKFGENDFELTAHETKCGGNEMKL